MSLTLERPVRLPAPAPRSLRPTFRAELAALYLPFLLLVVLTFANTPDDALITLRFAHNVVTDGQPVYNLGEHTEGFTSPLHLLVAGAVTWLPGGFVLLKMKLLSVLFAAGALWQLRRLLAQLSIGGWVRLVGLFLVSSSWSFATSASNGLETSLVALLGTGLAAGLVAGDPPVRPAVWGALLAVARPESILVIACLVAATVYVSPHRPWWKAAQWAVGPLLAFGSLLVFRLAYYGSVLPNTYYAKNRSLSRTAQQGFDYLLYGQPWGRIWQPLAVVLAVVLVVLLLVAVGTMRRRPGLAFPLAIVAGQVIAVLQAGGDWMHGGRFLAPALPAVAALVCAGLIAISRWRTTKPVIRALAGVFIVAMAAPVGSELAPAWTLRGTSESMLIADSNNGPISSMWLQAVDAVDCLQSGQSVAYSEAGLLGFRRPDLTVIDTRGLTDHTIAVTAPAIARTMWGVVERRWYESNSVVGRVLKARHPEMVLEFDSYPRRTAIDGMYRLQRVIPWRDGRPLSIYVRRDVRCPMKAAR